MLSRCSSFHCDHVHIYIGAYSADLCHCENLFRTRYICEISMLPAYYWIVHLTFRMHSPNALQSLFPPATTYLFEQRTIDNQPHVKHKISKVLQSIIYSEWGKHVISLKKEKTELSRGSSAQWWHSWLCQCIKSTVFQNISNKCAV